MKTRLKITEKQLKTIKGVISEDTIHPKIVKEMKADLDSNYTVVEKFMREGGEYSNKPMIMVNVDEEIISPKSLYEYLKFKYKVGESFTKQVIKDWCDGKISDDYRLSKNVRLTDEVDS